MFKVLKRIEWGEVYLKGMMVHMGLGVSYIFLSTGAKCACEGEELCKSIPSPIYGMIFDGPVGCFWPFVYIGGSLGFGATKLYKYLNQNRIHFHGSNIRGPI